VTLDSSQIEVLLSTYNGELYVGALLESLWAQTIGDFRLRIRDDGSHDGTVNLLRELSAREPRVTLTVGANDGAAQSFLELLRSADPGADLVALCDQDDVWFPQKLEWGRDALSGLDGPALYCGGIIITDEDLEPLRQHRVPRRGPSFANALVENIATGATIMLNRAAVNLASKSRPQNMVMHDQWLYLLVSGCGTVIYDPRPQVLYRQHGSNAVGIAKGFEDWRRRARRQGRAGHKRVLTKQARELRDLHYADLDATSRNQLDDFLGSGDSLLARMRYACFGATFRQRKIDNLIYRVLYFLKRV